MNILIGSIVLFASLFLMYLIGRFETCYKIYVYEDTKIFKEIWELSKNYEGNNFTIYIIRGGITLISILFALVLLWFITSVIGNAILS